MSRKAKLKPNPRARAAARLIASIPGVKDIGLRKKGRYSSKPSESDWFSILPVGKRKPIEGKFPKAALKSVKARERYLVSVLSEYAIEKAKRETPRRAARAERAAEREQEKKKQLAFQAAEGKRKAQREIERQKQEALDLDQQQIEAVRKANLPRLPGATPKLSKLRATRAKDDEIKYDIPGRNVLESKQKKEQRDRELGIRVKPRSSGIEDFQGKKMILRKMHVDLPETGRVPVFAFNAKAVAVTMKEFFKQYAAKFVDENRGRTEEAYIMRFETLNRLEGKTDRAEGVGTPRFRMPRRINPGDLPFLKQEYPGLTYDQILREIQRQALESQLDRLADYFADRYTDYLSRRVVSSMAVTGFTMEVVEKIV